MRAWTRRLKTGARRILVVASLALAACTAPRAMGLGPSPVAPMPGASPAVSSVAATSGRAPSAEASPVAAAARGALCHSDSLSLSLGPMISEATGQHTLTLVLTNRSPEPCRLEGYPDVTLLGPTGQPLAYRYRFTGDQMVTTSPPAPVTVPPSGAGYVTLNQYRCDRGPQATVRTVQITPPGSTAPLSLTLPEARQQLAYCGPNDAGSVVAVSPVEPSLTQTLNHHQSGT